MRAVHLVGSIPAPSTAAALVMVKQYVGERLRCCVSDGETGERWDWLARIIDHLREHPDLELVRDGRWKDFDDTPVFAVKPGHEFNTVELDYLRAYRESWVEFERFRKDLSADSNARIALQIGIPGPIDLSVMAFGFEHDLWRPHVGTFTRATVQEITAIHGLADKEVVFQMEVPCEMCMLIEESPSDWPGAAEAYAREITDVIAQAPPGTRFGVHLCWGDLQWATREKLSDVTALVLMANALARHWPSGRSFEFLHAPFVIGYAMPVFDPAYYAPLEKLALPAATRFIGGFIDERLSLEELCRIRDAVEAATGREIDIASTCGLGRRTPDVAIRHMQLACQVAA